MKHGGFFADADAFIEPAIYLINKYKVWLL